MVFISQVETHEPIRAFFRPGHARADPCAAASARRCSPTTRPAAVERIVREQGLAAFTERTITDPARLAAELAAIRARGWAMDDEERTEGMRCIAAPIFNEFREAIAGVSISGPMVRMAAGRRRGFGAGCGRRPTGSPRRSGGRRRDRRRRGGSPRSR